MPRPKNDKVTCSIRERKDCRRYELIVRDPFFGKIYGGLFKNRKDAEDLQHTLTADAVSPGKEKIDLAKEEDLVIEFIYDAL